MNTSSTTTTPAASVETRKTISDPAGVEDPHTVFVTLPHVDPDDGYVLPPSVCIDSKVNFAPGQAREVAAALTWFAEELEPTPVSPATLFIVETAAGALGMTLDELAREAGVERGQADWTREDGRRLTDALGAAKARRG